MKTITLLKFAGEDKIDLEDCILEYIDSENDNEFCLSFTLDHVDIMKLFAKQMALQNEAIAQDTKDYLFNIISEGGYFCDCVIRKLTISEGKVHIQIVYNKCL